MAIFYANKTRDRYYGVYHDRVIHVNRDGVINLISKRIVKDIQSELLSVSEIEFNAVTKEVMRKIIPNNCREIMLEIESYL